VVDFIVCHGDIHILCIGFGLRVGGSFTNESSNEPAQAQRCLKAAYINWVVKKPVITVLPRSRNDGQKRVSVGSIHPSCDWAEYS
jgi:hypothetical protein